MKRKYYKYTDSYCRHLRAITCVPIRFKLPIVPGMYCIRRISNTQVALDGWVPCDGRMISKERIDDLLQAGKVFEADLRKTSKGVLNGSI